MSNDISALTDLIETMRVICIIAGLYSFIVYLLGCFRIRDVAAEKGHRVNILLVFFFGVPYMLYVMSLPDLKLRNGEVTLSGTSYSEKRKADPKAVIAVAVIAVLLIGGYFAAKGISQGSVKKDMELATTEYTHELDSMINDVINSDDCRERGVSSIKYRVTCDERSAKDDDYILFVTFDCTADKKYSSYTLEDLDNTLVAYEIVNNIPSDIKLNNGKRATLYNDSTQKQVNVYVNNKLVYYPGFKPSY